MIGPNVERGEFSRVPVLAPFRHKLQQQEHGHVHPHVGENGEGIPVESNNFKPLPSTHSRQPDVVVPPSSQQLQLQYMH